MHPSALEYSSEVGKICWEKTNGLSGQLKTMGYVIFHPSLTKEGLVRAELHDPHKRGLVHSGVVRWDMQLRSADQS